jgi:hypothetical protein
MVCGPIEYSRPLKVLRKSALHLLFILPKSSFGEHDLESILMHENAIAFDVIDLCSPNPNEDFGLG